MSNQTPCRPCQNLDESYSKGGHAMRIARRILTERDGPPQPGEICRHECSNDSTAPNGWVCSEHTVWGTSSENTMDQDPEVRKARSAAGGKAVAASGQLDRIRSTASCAKGGKAGGKHPLCGMQKQVTCTHCKKTTNAANHAQWHGDRCKDKLISALIDDDSDGQLNLIYDS